MLRIYNARIWTGERYIDGGELWTQDGEIRYVGDVSPLIMLPWDREIDAKGNLIIPSFKNAHAHSPMVFLRSAADDMALNDWLFKQVFPREAKLTPDDCYWLTRLAILEYLSGGISVVGDMYFHLESIASACVDSGFRNVIMQGVTANNIQGLEKSLQRDIDILGRMGELINYRLGLHAEYTNSQESIKALADFARSAEMPVYAHLSETASEVEECVKRHGLTPGVYLAKLGLFDFGGTAYHFVHPTDDDIAALKEKGVSVVSCPASNLKLASGIAPLKKLIDGGLNVALGTDGAASNNCLDMFKEMFLAAGLQKATLCDPIAIDGSYVLKMAMANGAKSMGLDDCDTIEAGKKADLVMIDLSAPNMQPINNPLKNLVYAGNKSNVMMTIVNGIVRYERGEYFVGESVGEIYSRCQRISDRIMDR